MKFLKIWLDDIRPAPYNWTHVKTASAAIKLLKDPHNKIMIISLDHDLGPESAGTGYDVVKFIEERVHCTDFIPPEMRVHSANPVGRKNMEAGISNIMKFYKNKIDN